MKKIKKIISGDIEVAANDKEKTKTLMIEGVREQLWELHQAYL